MNTSYTSYTTQNVGAVFVAYRRRHGYDYSPYRNQGTTYRSYNPVRTNVVSNTGISDRPILEDRLYIN
jgi:hypothetical protein